MNFPHLSFSWTRSSCISSPYTLGSSKVFTPSIIYLSKCESLQEALSQRPSQRFVEGVVECHNMKNRNHSPSLLSFIYTSTLGKPVIHRHKSRTLNPAERRIRWLEMGDFQRVFFIVLYYFFDTLRDICSMPTRNWFAKDSFKKKIIRTS